ncbi:hypothetical protein JL978_15675 [Acinetobacter baumannii]|nr:hypothetical protein [Acinetobacter baumannii]
MSAKLVVTLLATSLLTVGCVAYTDDPYYRGGYGYHVNCLLYPFAAADDVPCVLIV